MLYITPAISISEAELTYTYFHASGPGGQNDNKVSTAVQLRFNLGSSPSLSDNVKIRLRKLAGSKLTQEGIMVIESKRFRTQKQNKAESKKRLVDIIRKALVPPKKRVSTRPTSASRLKRLDSKRRKGKTKSIRSSINE
jgi:ribosome-associated protein